MNREASAGPHLVRRFAFASLAIFIAAGAVLSFVLVRRVREQAEEDATAHALFVARTLLAPALADHDFAQPLTGADLAEMDALSRGLTSGDGRDVRVKIWTPDGMVVYSDYHPIVGQVFEDEAEELEEVVDGESTSRISDLQAEENVGERSFGRLFETYVPLAQEPGGPVVGVAEIYQSYGGIQARVNDLIRVMLLTFVVALALLWAALLPLQVRAARTLQKQMEDLRTEHERVEALLATEQQRVAELHELDVMKSDFVAAASHELRTPLTSIIGSVDTLLKPDLLTNDSDRTIFLESIRLQSRRLFRLVRRLLTASLVEEHVTLHPQPVDLRAVIDEVVSMSDGVARIQVLPDGQLPELHTDPELVGEVLEDLLDNALKFSPRESPVVLGWHVVRDGSDPEVELWVRDEGPGMTPAQRAHLFERFRQGDASSTRAFGGLGLGLHVAKGIVDDLGGTLTVETAPGEGSTFTFSIPQLQD